MHQHCGSPRHSLTAFLFVNTYDNLAVNETNKVGVFRRRQRPKSVSVNLQRHISALNERNMEVVFTNIKDILVFSQPCVLQVLVNREDKLA